MNMIKKIYENTNLKRKMATVLCVVMLVQTVIGGTIPTLAEPIVGETTIHKDMTDKGQPGGYFSSILLDMLNTVGDSNNLNLSIDATVNHNELNAALESLIDAGTITGPTEFPKDDDEKKFSSYEAYLDAQTALEPLNFSWTFNKMLLNVDEKGIKQNIIAAMNGKTVVIGVATIKNVGGFPTLSVELNRFLYYKTDVTIHLEMDVEFKESYTPGAKITENNSPGDSDISLNITDEGGSSLQDNGYELTKKVASRSNSDPEIVYIISAKASSSEAADAALSVLLDVASKSEAETEPQPTTEAPTEATSQPESQPTTEAPTEATSQPETQPTTEAPTEATSQPETQPTTEAPTIQPTVANEILPQPAEEDPANVRPFSQNMDIQGEEELVIDRKILSTKKRANRITTLSDKLDEIFKPDFATSSDGEVTNTSNLYGKKIIDTIPADLTVQKVEVQIDHNKWMELTEGSNGYTLDLSTNTISYSIPDGVSGFDTTSVITQADIRITTRLSDAVFNRYAQGGLEYEEVFPNRAKLKDETDQLLKISNEVRPFIAFSAFLKKNGASVDVTNKEFKWTLHMNANFSNSSVQAWMIDHIEDVGNTHDYNVDAGIMINKQDLFSITKISKGGKNNVTQDYPYESLKKVADLEKLFTYCGMTMDMTKPVPDSNKTVYIYDYLCADGKRDAVMLIPLNPAYTNGKLEINYNTKVTKDMTDPGNFAENLTMMNEAKAVWRWPTGDGTNPWDEYGGITVDKNLQGNYHVFSKNAWKEGTHNSTYDETTNTLTWNFEINQVGAEMTDVVLTDQFNPTEQLLLLKDSGAALDLKDLNGNVVVTADCKTQGGNPKTPYYEITTEGDKDVFRLHMGTVAATDHYRFSLMVKVMDVTMDSESSMAKVSNTADLSCKIGDKLYNSTKTATADVANTILQKTSIPVKNGISYDYTNHTVKWKVIVNPKHFAMGIPTLTDILPEGTCLEDISVTRKVNENSTGESLSFKGTGTGDSRTWGDVTFSNQESISVVQVATTSSATPPKYAHRAVTFTFNEQNTQNTNSTYEFEYTTSLDEDYRKGELTGGAGTGIELKNKVMLANNTGTIRATDLAKNKINPSGMTKDGKYKSYKGPGDLYNYPMDDGTNKSMAVDVIHWTLFVNKTNADLSGVKIQDTLADFLELVPASLKVDHIKQLTADGNIAASGSDALGNVEDVTDQFKKEVDHSIEPEGFSLTIPSELAKATLRLNFDTILIDNANASSMKNTVALSGSGVNSSITSGKAEGAKDFRLSSYATASGVYYASIKKVSTNQAVGGDFPLPGAKFRLVKMVPPNEEIERKDISKWNEISPLKEKFKTSNSKGNANFLFLAADTMYKLTEVEAPAGYVKSNKTWYLVAKLDKKAESDFPASPTDATANWEIQIPSDRTTQNIFQTITNGTSDSGGEVSFRKVNADGKTGLAGAKFSITHTLGQLEFQPVTSGADGMVTITGLDKTSSTGRYKIQEIEAPEGYWRENNEFYVKVDYTGGQYHATIEGLNAGEKIIVNQPLVPKIVFSKVDQNEEAIGSNRMNVSFEIERTSGTIGVTEQNPSDGTNITIPTSISNDEKGMISLDLPYGTYTLTENLAKDQANKLIDETKLAKIYIKVEKEGELVAEKTKVSISTDSNFAENDTKTIIKDNAEVATSGKNLFDFSQGANSFQVINELKYGNVQINKVLGERDSNRNLAVVTQGQKAIPIPGATFSVFHAVNGTKNGSAVMTLTTDTAGQFPINLNGSYTVNGKEKFLLCGDYILEEVSVPSDYVKNTKSYPFIIIPGTIGSDNTYQPTETVVGSNDSNNPNDNFINEPIRGTVKLQKVDKDHLSKELNDAVFEVHTQTNPAIHVANLTYQTDGYKLEAIGKGTSPKKGNLEYLHQEGTVYKLLKGTYDLIEITAPTLSDGTTGGNSYPLPTNPVGTFEIIKNNQIIDELTGNRDITNTIIKHSFTLQKKVEQWQVEGNTGKHKDYSADSSGFQFTLSGTAANGATTVEGKNQSYVVSGTTNAKGTCEFIGVPVGNYTLSETGVGSVYRFGLNSSEESVTKMSDICVKVTAAGITFTRKNMALGATTEDTKNQGTDSVSGTGDGQIVTVYNKLKIGSITGTKVGVGNIATGSVALPNAKFGLYKRENINPYATTTTTEQSNAITFSNIPFGDYYVKEITAPVGYMEYTEVHSVTVDKESPATFILKESNGNEQPIKNKLILKSLNLRKVDQNGVPLGTDRLKAQFSITKTDSNPTIPATIYTVPDNLSNDSTGVISIPDLAYGTYKVEENLTELESKNVDNGTSAVLPVFYIRVEAADAPDEDTHTKITVSNHSSFSTSQSGNVTRSITMSNTDSAIYDFSDTAKPSTLFTVINRMKYGTIAINKVSAEKDGPIGATPTYSDQKALAGATFAIYKGSKDEDIKLENLILTLETDAFGHFPTADADGTYTDSQTKKRVILLAGSYLLKEVSAPTTDYTILTGAIPFTITDKSQMVTFHYEGTEEGTSTNIDATASFTEKFYNVIPRGTISFKKVAFDNERTVVHGAVFGLVSQNPGVNQGKVVAFITEDGGEQSHTGTYRLTETTEELKALLPSKYAYADLCGVIPYVRKDSAPSTVCKVLPGTYKLVELKTGDDYVLPTGDANIIVPSLVVKDGENTELGTNGQITNTLKTADITIRKQIEDFAVGTYQDYTQTPADKFEFTLTGTTVSGTPITPKTYKIGATGFSPGEVEFTNIPVGQYKLKETKHPDNYYDMKPTEFSFNVQNDGTVIASPSDAMLNPSSPNPKNTYSIGNQVKRNIIYGKKVTTLGGVDYPVKGAVFGLFDYSDHELTSESSGTRATSAADGTFKFENIPWLMDVKTERYYIKEVTTPDGYAVNSTQYPITVSAQVMDQSQTSQVEITHQNPLRINNTSIPIAVKLKKIDQNGNSVKFSKIPLTFTLTQMADGQDPVSGFAVTAKNAEDGSITFSNLRYGSYKLTESPSDYVIDEETESAEVRIEPGTNSQTKVTITYKGKTQSIEQSTSVSESNCYDFTQKKDVAMVNEVNYGLIQINKIIGKVNRDGTLTPVEEAGKSKPLAGVQFKVYVDSDEDGAATPSECTDDKAVLTLVTDAEGHFAVNENHQYMNGSQAQEYRLLYGEHYLLREISAPEGYAVSTAIYPFNMTGLAKVGETIYMGADPDDKNIDLGSLSSGNGDIRVSSEQTCVFPNGSPYRGKIELMKLDREEPKRHLLGAEFDVYATIIDRKIGRLTDLAIKGSYQLVRGDTGYTTYDPSGQPYLHEEQGELMLLPGSYYLVETKAPTGYILPSSAERWYFELENKPNEVIENTDLRADQTPQATDKILDNQIAKHEVAIQKYVQEKLHTVTYHTANAADHLTEIEFLLEGKTINQEKYEVRKSLSAEMDAAGTVRFEDVPSGTYTLTELNIPNQYVIPASITVTVGVDGVTYNDSGIASQPVRLNNDLKRGAIQGIKKSNRGILLPGAEIGLFPSTTTVFTEENLYSGLKSISNNEGIFRFDHILCGDYLVAELQAPNGYRLNTTTSYLVHITEQGQVVTIGDKKIQNVGTKPVVEPAVEILIINDKKSSHGGDDPTTSPTKPTEPTLPTDPTQPTAPTLPTDPTDQTTPELPTIPANPTDPAKPDLPPGTIVEIPDPENPASPPLYVGPYDPDHRYTGFPPGDYEMVTINSEGSPLAKFYFHIDENGTPLAIIPKVGDSSVPTAALAVILIVSLAGVGIIWKRKREDKESHE